MDVRADGRHARLKRADTHTRRDGVLDVNAPVALQKTGRVPLEPHPAERAAMVRREAWSWPQLTCMPDWQPRRFSAP